MLHKPLSSMSIFDWGGLLLAIFCILVGSYLLGKDDLKAIWFIVVAILIVEVMR